MAIYLCMFKSLNSRSCSATVPQQVLREDALPDISGGKRRVTVLPLLQISISPLTRKCQGLTTLVLSEGWTLVVNHGDD